MTKQTGSRSGVRDRGADTRGEPRRITNRPCGERLLQDRRVLTHARCTITSPVSVASSFARGDAPSIEVNRARFLTQHTQVLDAAADEPRSVVAVRAVRWRSRRSRDC